MAFFGLLGDPLSEAKSKVAEINKLEESFAKLPRDELRAKTREWREHISNLTPRPLSDIGEGKGEVVRYLDEILPEAFAVVREAAKRTLGQRHFDVQMMGGIVLHQGKVAEMKTGEGKTLASTASVYLNALSGQGVHVVTVNDYLARRDASWMGQIYHYLGFSVGAIGHEVSYLYGENNAPQPPLTVRGGEGELSESVEVQIDVKNLSPVSRREAYAADVVYGTNNEFGFDYLRDNMAQTLEQRVQRALHYAIVDEVDSILIDEARTPLIISAPDAESTDLYREFSNFMKNLEPDDYVHEEKHRQVNFTEKGYEKLESKYGQEILSDIKLRHHADSALRAAVIFKKDRDYVVKDGEIIIVDEFTGRLMFGRRYSEGLHQAIEAKEGVPVKHESKTLATITFQNYFRLYSKLAGMTGTAATEAEEFHKIYKLDVVEIPTHRPMERKDLPDSIYKSEKGKFDSIVREIKERNAKGQPMLVGTISIERNELLSELLKRAGVQHTVLNAKNHEQEAHIIAQAGRFGAVTLATNIAGRGVDIILGGNPPDADEAKRVRDAGGLHVLGTERHEARRIDNQLRGRSGRQGDPGSSQFYLSLEDDLMRIFGGDRVKGLMTTLGVPDDQPIENRMVSRSIESAQHKIEGMNFDIRKHVLEFDDVLNKQRTVIYSRRYKILAGEMDLKPDILKKAEEEIARLVGGFEDTQKLIEAFASLFPLSEDVRAKISQTKDRELWINHLTEASKTFYEQKEQKLGSPLMRQLEKVIALQAIDRLWMEHLDTMDHLRQSVRLRGYAQKDPLVEYKQDGLRLFERLLHEIDRAMVFTIFRAEVAPRQHTHVPASGTAPGGKEIGRNDPCPCGAINPETGKVYKYKKCGMINAPYHKK